MKGAYPNLGVLLDQDQIIFMEDECRFTVNPWWNYYREASLLRHDAFTDLFVSKFCSATLNRLDPRKNTAWNNFLLSVEPEFILQLSELQIQEAYRSFQKHKKETP